MKARLDTTMVDRGITRSRQKARALIMEGKVLVNDMPVSKAGTLVDSLARIRLREPEMPFVSRGGLKLKAAIDQFGINLRDAITMDVGSSTGGFTHCMLLEGAARVYAVDVGYGQLDWKLRQDPRVVLMERTNFRLFERDSVPEELDFVSVDVSFISLRLILPGVWKFLRPDGEAVALVKPQFEAGREEVGKGGIVRDPVARKKALQGVREAAEALGFEIKGVMDSPIKGQKGNVEYLMHLIKKGE